jgi:4-alpha-glucanotransferase
MSAPDRQPRRAGLLLHPTSLPGPYGVGDLGPAAYEWVDDLAFARQGWWQVLPLGPTGYGASPYQALSAFAGNPLLISPEVLAEEGLLRKADLKLPDLPAGHVDYDAVNAFKDDLLARAFRRFRSRAGARLRPDFEEFCGLESDWLDDYALFMAIKKAHGGADWMEWPGPLALRRPEALAEARRELGAEVAFYQLTQFLFSRQWQALKRYANDRGVRLIGDLPIFVAGDSADVWAHPELFQLDERHRPKVVAGVPPDYFSKTGQLWGNPLYDWEAHSRSGFAWWVARLRCTLEQVDLVRIDHFRGFESYWEVPAGMPTAEQGRWVKAPGDELFDAVRAALGRLPLIAEDLGLITPEVESLRRRAHLPGMRVLQFAFGGAVENRFLPHNYERDTVVYTGTHDNDTTPGWFATLTPGERTFLRRYAPAGPDGVHWDLIRLAWSSVANDALAPLQDVLGLGSEARTNFPGRVAGNWRWRFTAGQLTRPLLERLGDFTEVYERCDPPPAE